MARTDRRNSWCRCAAAYCASLGPKLEASGTNKTAELNAYKSNLEKLVQERTKDLEAANQQLSILATTDSLTGAYNRRRFVEMGEREHARSQRSMRPYSLIAFDVDHFKSINDNFGHGIGDEVLKKIVVGVKNHLRVSDILGRLGGEEFFVLLADTTRAQAVVIAERYRKAIEDIDFGRAGINVRVSASFGVCDFNHEELDFADLMHKADEALYEAKRQGRNRIALA